MTNVTFWRGSGRGVGPKTYLSPNIILFRMQHLRYTGGARRPGVYTFTSKSLVNTLHFPLNIYSTLYPTYPPTTKKIGLRAALEGLTP